MRPGHTCAPGPLGYCALAAASLHWYSVRKGADDIGWQLAVGRAYSVLGGSRKAGPSGGYWQEELEARTVLLNPRGESRVVASSHHCILTVPPDTVPKNGNLGKSTDLPFFHFWC